MTERMTAAEYLAGLAAPPAARRPAKDVEGPVHRAVLDTLRLRLGPAYIVQHTPNRPRSKVQGGREKRLGAVRGWPDLAIYGPGRTGSTVWFAEVKPPGVTMPEYQRELHDRLRGAGFEVAVLRGVEDVDAALAGWGLPVR